MTAAVMLMKVVIGERRQNGCYDYAETVLNLANVTLQLSYLSSDAERDSDHDNTGLLRWQ